MKTKASEILQDIRKKIYEIDPESSKSSSRTRDEDGANDNSISILNDEFDGTEIIESDFKIDLADNIEEDYLEEVEDIEGKEDEELSLSDLKDSYNENENVFSLSELEEDSEDNEDAEEESENYQVSYEGYNGSEFDEYQAQYKKDFNEDSGTHHISQTVAQSVKESFAALSNVSHVLDSVNSLQDIDYELVAERLMNTKIDKWLDENLARLVEAVVREEIRKLIP